MTMLVQETILCVNHVRMAKRGESISEGESVSKGDSVAVSFYFFFLNFLFIFVPLLDKFNSDELTKVLEQCSMDKKCSPLARRKGYVDMVANLGSTTRVLS